MQISISGHHVEVTEAMREYLLEKFEKLERHSELVTTVKIIVTVAKNRQTAEATIHIKKGGEVFADATSEDLYAAIDMLVDKLDRQMVKHKEKMLDRKQRAVARQ